MPESYLATSTDRYVTKKLQANGGNLIPPNVHNKLFMRRKASSIFIHLSGKSMYILCMHSQ